MIPASLRMRTTAVPVASGSVDPFSAIAATQPNDVVDVPLPNGKKLTSVSDPLYIPIPREPAKRTRARPSTAP